MYRGYTERVDVASVLLACVHAALGVPGGSDEYSATLARWFGVGTADLSTIFPNLGRFNNPNLGVYGVSRLKSIVATVRAGGETQAG
jgi:hypothetical protein